MSQRMLFVNLAVRDVARTMEFFAGLGFAFNPQYTGEKSACMIINDMAYIMLLDERYFQTFTNQAVCDTSAATEALLAISCDSREEVDRLVGAAIAAGGRHALEPQDHGFMYGWSFYDLDGHHWEVAWMDPAGMGD